MKLSSLLLELKVNSSSRVHLSNKPFKLEKRTYKQDDAMKPAGFWYGFGNEWIDWVRTEMSSKFSGDYIYNVDVSKCKLLKIDSHMELMIFTRHYNSPASQVVGDKLDWKTISTRYDGIEINPYQDEARYQYLWYYGWDVASGCVWNLDKLKISQLNLK